MSVATICPDGRIHLVAMWYGFIGGWPAFHTYAKSQKVQNLRRDPRITVLVEDGDTYDSLRGVQISGTGEIVEDEETKVRLALEVMERYGPAGSPPGDRDMRAFAERFVTKRVAVRIHPERVVSWDHRKL